MIDSEKLFLIGDPSQKSRVNETISSLVSLTTLVDASNLTVKGSVPTVFGVTSNFPIISILFTLIGKIISVLAQLDLSSTIILAS